MRQLVLQLLDTVMSKQSMVWPPKGKRGRDRETKGDGEKQRETERDIIKYGLGLSVRSTLGLCLNHRQRAAVDTTALWIHIPLIDVQLDGDGGGKGAKT